LSRVARWHILKTKILTWINFGGPAMEDVGICYGHLAYFTTIWYILWPFGMFYGYLVYFSRFGMFGQEKSGYPGVECEEVFFNDRI
jgi:hypothetical protein